MITVQAFPDEGFVGLVIPKDAMPNGPVVSHYVLRFKSADGFVRFMTAAAEEAAKVWPEIAAALAMVDADEGKPS